MRRRTPVRHFHPLELVSWKTFFVDLFVWSIYTIVTILETARCVVRGIGTLARVVRRRPCAERANTQSVLEADVVGYAACVRSHTCWIARDIAVIR